MPADGNDPEIREFVLFSREQSFSAIAASIQAKFGADRAWPVDLVATVRRQMDAATGESPIERDGEVMAVVRDSADLVTLDALRGVILDRFGAARTPSRAALGRIVSKERIRARQAAAGHLWPRSTAGG